MYFPDRFDVIIVGGGHAGTEAALASARMGRRTLLLTHNIETLGQMSCNPSIGGIGKGHLVKEIDALGGAMAAATDEAGIQFRIINSSKGPAVRATRAQADRVLYRAAIRGRIENQPNLWLFQGACDDLVIQGDRAIGAVTQVGIRFQARAIVLTAGTFLDGKVHVGLQSHAAGRAGDPPAIRLSARLKEFLPGPVVEYMRDADGARYVFAMPAKSIGQVSTFYGNFGMLVRAYAYIRQHGAEGLRKNSEHAVLNANYLRVKLRDTFTVPFDRTNMHEFVCRGAIDGTGVRALDVSKRLLDYGFHPPTNYFPLIVPEALMIEPTETEAKPTLDAFTETMQAIAKEAVNDPALVKAAPHETPIKRLDEIKAARELRLCDQVKAATND